jgi:hypothetical protein
MQHRVVAITEVDREVDDVAIDGVVAVAEIHFLP